MVQYHVSAFVFSSGNFSHNIFGIALRFKRHNPCTQFNWYLRYLRQNGSSWEKKKSEIKLGGKVSSLMSGTMLLFAPARLQPHKTLYYKHHTKPEDTTRRERKKNLAEPSESRSWLGGCTNCTHMQTSLLTCQRNLYKIRHGERERENAKET